MGSVFFFKCFDSRFLLYTCRFVFVMYCNNMCGMMGAVRRPAIFFFFFGWSCPLKSKLRKK